MIFWNVLQWQRHAKWARGRSRQVVNTTWRFALVTRKNKKTRRIIFMFIRRWKRNTISLWWKTKTFFFLIWQMVSVLCDYFWMNTQTQFCSISHAGKTWGGNNACDLVAGFSRQKLFCSTRSVSVKFWIMQWWWWMRTTRHCITLLLS